TSTPTCTGTTRPSATPRSPRRWPPSSTSPGAARRWGGETGSPTELDCLLRNETVAYAMSAEHNHALYAVFFHRVDAELRAAREVIRFLLEAFERGRRRTDDHRVLVLHRIAHRGRVVEVALHLRELRVGDGELRGRTGKGGDRVPFRESGLDAESA